MLRRPAHRAETYDTTMICITAQYQRAVVCAVRSLLVPQARAMGIWDGILAFLGQTSWYRVCCCRVSYSQLCHTVGVYHHVLAPVASLLLDSTLSLQVGASG
jgi:hypothetical protein